MIEVKSLSYSYDKNHNVFNDVSFKINDGEIALFLGTNGQGKSTLLKCLSGIHKIEKNKVFIDGKDIALLSKKERSKIISYVPQELSLAPLTVFEVVMMGRIPYGYMKNNKHDIEIVSDTLKMLNIEHLSSRYISSLSGGEKQLVSIARALAQEAKYIILDEPMNNLDLNHQFNLANIIKDLTKERNITFLITMHDIFVSLEFGNRFLILKDHTLYKDGDNSIFDEELIRNVYHIETTKVTIKDNEHFIYKRK